MLHPAAFLALVGAHPNQRKEKGISPARVHQGFIPMFSTRRYFTCISNGKNTKSPKIIAPSPAIALVNIEQKTINTQ